MVNPSLLTKQTFSSTSTPSLESRISGLATRNKSNQAKKNKKAVHPASSINIRGSSLKPAQVIVSNLAPGTSSEDVKVALTSYGNILDASPNPVASSDDSLAVNLFFEKLEDAQSAVQAFDGLLADGKVLSVVIVENNRVEDVQSLFAGSKMYADTITPAPQSPPKPTKKSKKEKKPPTGPKAMEDNRLSNPPAKPVLSLLERTQMQPKAKKGDNQRQVQQSHQGAPSLLERMSGGALRTTQQKKPAAKSLAERLGL